MRACTKASVRMGLMLIFTGGRITRVMVGAETARSELGAAVSHTTAIITGYVGLWMYYGGVILQA